MLRPFNYEGSPSKRQLASTTHKQARRTRLNSYLRVVCKAGVSPDWRDLFAVAQNAATQESTLAIAHARIAQASTRATRRKALESEFEALTGFAPRD